MARKPCHRAATMITAGSTNHPRELAKQIYKMIAILVPEVIIVGQLKFYKMDCEEIKVTLCDLNIHKQSLC